MKKKNINGVPCFCSKYNVPHTFSPIWTSEGMSGKMEGMPAISTACTCNPICKARAKDPCSICSHCYAFGTLNAREWVEYHAEENYDILTARVLTWDEVPMFRDGLHVRLEAFGDLANVTQALNYLRIAAVNPACTFAIWTKNPAFLDKAIKEFGKPCNLICILSSSRVNVVADASRWWWVDHVFTVYDPEYIEREGIVINCGARDCKTCLHCYTHGTAFYINEKLK